jgi:hypothetical protein
MLIFKVKAFKINIFLKYKKMQYTDIDKTIAFCKGTTELKEAMTGFILSAYLIRI